MVKGHIGHDYFYGAPALILILGDKLATNAMVDLQCVLKIFYLLLKI